MKKRGLAMLSLSVFISAIVLLVLFLTVLFSYAEWFRFEGEMVQIIITVLGIIIVASGFTMVVLMAKEKNAHYQFILNPQENPDVCPVCNLNISKDCQCCPNCKTKIQRR